MADDEIPVNPDIKPRTVPEALGLSDRKAKAIYQTVVEALKNGKTPEVLAEMQSLFPDLNEAKFASYCLGTRIAVKSAGKPDEDEIERRVNERLSQIIPQIIQQVGQQAAQFGHIETLKQLHEAEKAGFIKIIKTGKVPVENETPAPVPEEGMPDEILYGTTNETGSGENNKQEPAPKKKETKPESEPEPKNGKDYDPAYG